MPTEFSGLPDPPSDGLTALGPELTWMHQVPGLPPPASPEVIAAGCQEGGRTLRKGWEGGEGDPHSCLAGEGRGPGFIQGPKGPFQSSSNQAAERGEKLRGGCRCQRQETWEGSVKGETHVDTVRGGSGAAQGPSWDKTAPPFLSCSFQDMQRGSCIGGPSSFPRAGTQLCTYCRQRSLQRHLWGESRVTEWWPEEQGALVTSSLQRGGQGQGAGVGRRKL